MAREEQPATAELTTRRFDRESAPMDYSNEAMREAFGRRQLWIQDMLKTETHTGFTVYDAHLDANTSILAVDIGMAHQTKNDIQEYGARGTAGKLLISLTRAEAQEVQDGLGQIDELLKGKNFRKNAPTYLFPRHGVRSYERLAQSLRAKACQSMIDQKIRDATSLDVEWHGFGGSSIAIEQTARNTMTKWTDDNPNSHRIKAVLSIMGAEKTRVNDPVWGVFPYHLEEHGKRQVQYATHELLDYVTTRKRENLEKRYANIQHLMLNGHSMGGEIAYAIALDEDSFRPQLLSSGYAVDANLDMSYLLNTPVTVGAKYDRSAVPLLGGWGGFLLKLGANKLAPYTTMRAGEFAGLVKLAHNKFFTPNTRHLYELAAHMKQMHIDPLYVAQCVYDLNRAPDMRALVDGNRPVLNKIISEGRMAAVIAQSDIILNPDKQFEALFDLDIPVFSLPGEDHYLYEQHQKLVTALQTKNLTLYSSLLNDWLIRSEVRRVFLDPIPYLTAVKDQLQETDAIESYKPLFELVFRRKDPIHTRALRKTREKLRKLIGKFFVENGWTFLSHEEALPITAVVENRYGQSEDARQMLASPVIAHIQSVFSRYYALLSVFDNAPATVTDAFLAATGLTTNTQDVIPGGRLPDSLRWGLLLQRNLTYLLHHQNALSAVGMSEFAQQILESGMPLPRTRDWTEPRTAPQRLFDHLSEMTHHSDTAPAKALAMYQALAHLIVDYVEELNRPATRQ